MHDIIDIIRRIESIIRLGIVAEVDVQAQPPAVRVKTGELLTDWRPWVASRAGDARSWHAPSVGEQVLLLSPSGDLGLAVVLPGLYSDDYRAPASGATQHRMSYPDGALIDYNPATGALTAAGIKTATIAASTLVTLDTPSVVATGNIHANGSISANGNVSDGTRSMAGDRAIYNSHTNPGDGPPPQQQ